MSFEIKEFLNPNFFKKAKRYCKNENCNIYICNSCALEDHTQHIENLQNIQIFYKKEKDSLDNFLNNSNNDFTNINNNMMVFKCMVNVFHGARNYCLECRNFICVKCTTNHDKTHQIVNNNQLLESLNEKIKLINIIFNKEKFFFKLLQEEIKLIEINKNTTNSLEEKITKNIFVLKVLHENYLKTLKNIKYIIFERINKTISKKCNFQFNKNNEFTKFSNFLDFYKFEKDKLKFFGSLINYEYLINSLITNQEINDFNQIIKFNDQIKGLFEETYKAFLITLNNNVDEIENLFQKYNQEILKNNQQFKNEFEKILQNFSFPKEDFINILENKDNIIIFNFDDKIFLNNINTGDRYITKEIYIEKPVESSGKEIFEEYSKIFKKNLNISNKFNFTICEQIKNKTDDYQDINRKEFQHNDIEVLKNVVSKQFSNEILIARQEYSITFYKQEKKKNFSDTKLKYVKFEEPNSNLKFEFCENNKDFTERELINLDSKSNDSKNKDKLIRKYTSSSRSSIKSLEKEILFDENLLESNSPEEKDFILDKTNNNKEVMIDINNKSNEKESPQELSELKNSILNQDSLIESNYIKEIKIIHNYDNNNEKHDSSLTEKSNPSNTEKDIKLKIHHDILSFGFNCKSCFAFNPSCEKKICEIENFYFKFPSFHSFLNVPPFAYIGGGKDYNGKESNTFSKFIRTEEKKIDIRELKNMNSSRHHHLYVFNKFKNQIICVGGSKIRACEVYDIETNSWAYLGDLNTSRECPSALVSDKNLLYVFFGFDKNVNKYVNTIERVSLENVNFDGITNDNLYFNLKFDIINIKGNQNIFCIELQSF